MPARVVFHRGVETSGNLQRELNESETLIDLLSVVYQVVVKIWLSVKKIVMHFGQEAMARRLFQ